MTRRCVQVTARAALTERTHAQPVTHGMWNVGILGTVGFMDGTAGSTGKGLTSELLLTSTINAQGRLSTTVATAAARGSERGAGVKVLLVRLPASHSCATRLLELLVR